MDPIFLVLLGVFFLGYVFFFFFLIEEISVRGISLMFPAVLVEGFYLIWGMWFGLFRFVAAP